MSLNPHDDEYLKLLQHILDKGVDKGDRTGTGTRSVFGYQMRFDLSKSFPLLTTKKIFMKGIIHELLWFLSGDTNITYLVRNGVKIWNEWAFQVYLEETGKDKNLERYSEEWKAELKSFVKQIKEDDDFAQKWGELGPVYGKQWRKWESKHGEEIDQVANVIEDIKKNPNSRRHMISGWNIGEIDGLVKNQNRAPPPCHSLFQFYVSNGKLSCQLYQRSADVFLGVPFNIASYSLLTLMVAKVTGLEVGEFIHTFGDVHIYSNHMEQVKEQLSREAMEPTAQVVIHGEHKSIDDFKFEDFEVKEYKSHPSIKAPIAV